MKSKYIIFLLCTSLAEAAPSAELSKKSQQNKITKRKIDERRDQFLTDATRIVIGVGCCVASMITARWGYDAYKACIESTSAQAIAKRAVKKVDYGALAISGVEAAAGGISSAGSAAVQKIGSAAAAASSAGSALCATGSQAIAKTWSWCKRNDEIMYAAVGNAFGSIVNGFKKRYNTACIPKFNSISDFRKTGAKRLYNWVSGQSEDAQHPMAAAQEPVAAVPQGPIVPVVAPEPAPVLPAPLEQIAHAPTAPAPSSPPWFNGSGLVVNSELYCNYAKCAGWGTASLITGIVGVRLILQGLHIQFGKTKQRKEEVETEE